jgi:protein-disulfide isomerase
MSGFNRRLMLAAVAALSLSACNKLGGGGAGPAMNDDMTMGDPKAKVTMIEYASAACPHCAKFAIDVFPEFKKKYIDTGKVHYIFREVLTPPQEVAAAGFLLARCAGKDKYFTVLDGVFRSQQDWVQTGDVQGSLRRVAQSAGLSDQQYEACISDPKALAALNDRVQKYTAKDKVDGTPTFIFSNGKRLSGEQTMADMDKATTEALAAAK